MLFRKSEGVDMAVSLEALAINRKTLVEATSYGREYRRAGSIKAIMYAPPSEASDGMGNRKYCARGNFPFINC